MIANGVSGAGLSASVDAASGVRSTVGWSTADLVTTVDERLGQALAGDSAVFQAARGLVFADAKRARPFLFGVFSEYLGARLSDPTSRDQVVSAAAAVELIHSASLLHDDVVDQNNVRRGKPSAHIAHGSTIAVLAGDVMLSRALRMLAPLGLEAVTKASQVIEEMSLAAADEIAVRHRLDLPLDRWRAIAEGKTGALFGLCGQLSGLIAKRTEDGERLDRVCRLLGTAFQLADDAAELSVGNPEDIREGNPSFVVLRAVALNPSIETRISEARAQGDYADVISTIQSSDAPTEAKIRIRQLVADAQTELGADVNASALTPMWQWAKALCGPT